MRKILIVVVMVLLFTYLSPYLCQFRMLGTIVGAAVGVLLIDKR